MSEQLNKTYKTVHDADWGELKYATYHWGDVALSEYEHVTFRGRTYIVQTCDEPLVEWRNFLHPDGVAELNPVDYGAEPMPQDARAVCEYWATRQPGEVFRLEVTTDGYLYAAVWDGKIHLCNLAHDRRVTGTPQKLLDQWHDVALTLNGDIYARPFSCATLVGPVGTVADLEWWAGETDDRNPFESDMPDWLRDDTTPDADVWGNFIDGLDLD